MNRDVFQDETSAAMAAENIAPGMRVAIIGHRGRMGAMLMRRWLAAGLAVSGADRDSADDADINAAATMPTTMPARNAIAGAAIREAVAGARVVILAVPALVLPSLLDQAAPCLTAGQILADVTSVKMRPMREMEKRYAGPVVGTHPLFGPEPLPEDMLTAIVPGSNAVEEDIRIVEGLFGLAGSRSFRTTAEKHDRGAAYVQGLNFVSSAAYLASLAQRDDILPFLTPSFRRRLESARKLLTEDAPMFQGFTTANPLTADAIHTFRLFLDLVEGGGLPDVVCRARWWYEREGE